MHGAAKGEDDPEGPERPRRLPRNARANGARLVARCRFMPMRLYSLAAKPACNPVNHLLHIHCTSSPHEPFWPRKPPLNSVRFPDPDARLGSWIFCQGRETKPRQPPVGNSLQGVDPEYLAPFWESRAKKKPDIERRGATAAVTRYHGTCVEQKKGKLCTIA